MHRIRQNEIEKATKGQVWGLVLGSLGRQGSTKVLQVRFSFEILFSFVEFFQTIQQRLKTQGKKFVQLIMPELMPDKLKLFKNVDV